MVWRRGHARSGASGTAAMRGAVAAGASDDGASSEEEDEDGDSASEGPSSEDDSDDDEDEPRCASHAALLCVQSRLPHAAICCHMCPWTHCCAVTSVV